MTVSNAGAPVLTSSGAAVGMVGIIPQTSGGPAGVGNLANELAWLHGVPAFRHVQLALGTQPFVGLPSLRG
jgi:hypothetical protein